jgi:hypothetical protein
MTNLEILKQHIGKGVRVAGIHRASGERFFIMYGQLLAGKTNNEFERFEYVVYPDGLGIAKFNLEDVSQIIPRKSAKGHITIEVLS